MFGLFESKKHTKEVALFAPVTGTSMAITDVPDPVFSEKILGDGVGFEPTEGVVYAPCDATISIIADTKHAVGFTADCGAEILIHVGLNTVNLAGEGFEPLVAAGDKVKQGQAILKVDIDFLREKQCEITTPMIVTNADEFEIVYNGYGEVQAKTTEVYSCKKK